MFFKYNRLRKQPEGLWIVAFVLEEEKTAKDFCRLRTYIVNEANDGIGRGR